MPEDRLNDYLDSLTSFSPGLPYTHIVALDSYAPSYDEWNAARMLAGLLVDTFEEYIAAIKSGKRWNHE